MKYRPLFLLALVALSVAACSRSPKTPASVISRERFVEANVALRGLPDSASPDVRKATLEKVGVTDRQLRAWVRFHAREPATLAGAWERIAFRIDSIAEARPIRRAPGDGEPPTVELPPPSPIVGGDSAVIPRPRPRRRPEPQEMGDFSAPAIAQ